MLSKYLQPDLKLMSLVVGRVCGEVIYNECTTWAPSFLLDVQILYERIDSSIDSSINRLKV